MASTHPATRSTQELLTRAKDVLAYGGVYSVIEHPVEYPGGTFPLFADAAEGCWMRDTSGKWYIDWKNGWGTVVLGHRRAEVEAAIAAQFPAGPKLSLMHPFEVEVAEQIRAMVPCAEQVAFGKNGSDATLAAVRIARAYTRRDVILQCGYHGFHDWYKGLQRSCEGIPCAVRQFTVSFPYNDLDTLEKLFQQYQGRVAAVMMEPSIVSEPKPGYLESVRSLAHRQGALLIFDEVVTGFRVARGGGQEAYGVVPDLACLGKALSNGMPLSAVVGRRDVMRVLPRTGYMMTYQGETLSLAAARTTVAFHQTHPVVEHLYHVGTQIRERFTSDARDFGIPCGLVGPPARLCFEFTAVGGLSPQGLLTLFVQECLKHGVLTEGRLFPSFAHNDEAVERSSTAFRKALAVVKAAIDTGRLERFLHLPVEPRFYAVREKTRNVWQTVFDSNYYRDNNPDMQDRELYVLVHYLQYGGQEGRSPHPLFDSQYYLATYPDVRATDANPLLHYLQRGGFEGRKPHPLFDSQYYLSTNPDVRETGINPLVHYLQYGGSEGRNPHPIFDTKYYLDNHPEVREENINPLVHYLQYGSWKGYDPHPLFDSQYYLATNPDVREAGINPLVHYLQYGGQEGRNPHPFLDIQNYLNHHPDARDARMNPLVHYLTVEQKHLDTLLTRLYWQQHHTEPRQEHLLRWASLIACGFASLDQLEAIVYPTEAHRAMPDPIEVVNNLASKVPSDHRPWL